MLNNTTTTTQPHQTTTLKLNKPQASTNVIKDSKARHYERKIDKAKLGARSELDLFSWRKYNYAANNYHIPPHVDTVERIDIDEVSKDEFIRRFEEVSLPVVIQGCTRKWSAEHNWNKEYLLAHYGEQTFKVGEDDDGDNVYLKLKHFLHYVDSLAGQNDDSPLYIFDSGFEKLGRGQRKKGKKTDSENRPVNGSSSGSEVPVSKRRKVVEEESQEGEKREEKRKWKEEERRSKTLLDDYAVPEYFVDDLFRLTGERRRPPYRWFVMGGARSGTGIHIDPLGTSAWNTLLVGHKRWCMFPPSCPRFLSDPSLKPLDHEAVTWFEHVFPRFLQRDPTSECTLGEKYGMVQCLQGPGETMFVPGGWAHVVMNLDFTIAVTQNFCSPTNLESVFLRTRDSRPGLAGKLAREISLLALTEPRFARLREQIDALRYVPSIEPSSGSSTESTSSSESEKDGVSPTESESDRSDGTCMCRKCKMGRKRSERLESGNGNGIGKGEKEKGSGARAWRKD